MVNFLYNKYFETTKTEGIILKLLAVSYFGWSDATYDVFKDMGYEVDIVKPDQAPIGKGYQVLFCEASYITKNYEEYYENLKDVRLIQMQTAGHNHLPVEFMKKHPEISFCSGSGSYGKSISEWAIFGILQILRQTELFENYRKEKKWTWEGTFSSRELWGSTCGILGTGDIGLGCAEKLHAFNCKCIGLNTNGRHVEGFDECVPVSDIDELMPKCDIIINTLPLTEGTAMLVGRRQLELCKDGAVIVNVSRGGIIDEVALMELLESGKLAGAAFDCYDVEPVPEDSPLWTTKNFFLNPHCCGVTQGLSRRYVEQYIRNAQNYIDGKELYGIVVPGKGY